MRRSATPSREEANSTGSGTSSRSGWPRRASGSMSPERGVVQGWTATRSTPSSAPRGRRRPNLVASLARCFAAYVTRVPACFRGFLSPAASESCRYCLTAAALPRAGGLPRHPDPYLLAVQSASRLLGCNQWLIPAVDLHNNTHVAVLDAASLTAALDVLLQTMLPTHCILCAPIATSLQLFAVDRHREANGASLCQ